MSEFGAGAELPGWVTESRSRGEFFSPEESHAAAPAGFLQELPSYRSVLRRRAAAGDVQERWGNLRGIASAERREPQPDGGERGAIPLWELPFSIAEKRRIRDSQQGDIKYSSGWNHWKRTSSKSWKKALKDIKELSSYMQLWRHDIHSIEGKFGTGIQSYFSFLRFLVLLNFLMFILMFSFVTLPAVISNYGIFNSSSTKISPNNTEPYCTVYTPSGNKGLVYFYTYLKDLLTGTGFLEVTVLFYGYYTIDAAWFSVLRYNLPLAYLLTTFAYLALSFVWIIKRSVERFRQHLVHDEDQFQSYCNKVFAGWDFCITDLNAARLKHRSLLYELQTNLEEERLKQKIAERTMKEKLRIYSLRIFINIIVIAVLSGCFYSIYRATVFSQENSSNISIVGFQANLLVQYLPSIVITSANFIAPQIFSFLIAFEDYSAAFEIRLTLIRCVFVRLANVGVLLFSLWSQIHCDNDQCKACGYDYELYPCWESAVGQEMYKLLIFDFMIIIAMTLFVDFPRKLLVTYCSWKLVQWWGLQEFGISDNVLEIIYGQTICWIGTFFSPLLPAIATIKYFIIFYIKKISLIHTRKPASRPIRASSSNFFFLAVLLIGLILAFVPLGVSIALISSSKACGPFRNFNTSWAIVPYTILEFPIGLQKFLYGIASEAFAVPFFVIACLFMFYFIALAGAHKRVVEQLREQLVTSWIVSFSTVRGRHPTSCPSLQVCVCTLPCLDFFLSGSPSTACNKYLRWNKSWLTSLWRMLPVLTCLFAAIKSYYCLSGES
ncbi:transmembrane channel-like protein 7 isoform X2 [Gallus gallus]|uniref:transmembrane channel-like protein 7 isoform X2 n=1 Tax=Gallus gallus TaxID=9031 RepID=UPI001F022F98|nr:transmembrane channel-like protein 7 isoform X2 [Gallus gallus]